MHFKLYNLKCIFRFENIYQITQLKLYVFSKCILIKFGILFLKCIMNCYIISFKYENLEYTFSNILFECISKHIF